MNRSVYWMFPRQMGAIVLQCKRDDHLRTVAKTAANFVPSRNQSDFTSLSIESKNDCQSSESESQKRKCRHDLRNELNSANLAIHLSQKQMQIGRVKDAEESLSLAMQSLSRLDQLIDELE